ncbi:thioredoxin-dependent thiol peroxidase [Bartonella sp. HY406]|uniref:thioredoxin-dependent thiol peroxidase n=1 Tax=Bartonella sp. HY406 TaxID=2979331 RepID=UPI0021CA24FB|nr:thioredoxin-dependent thiol peroxidase [Bartonella sp. HY406]UXN04549.1 thioredoxin-dependent thiol peroxidase [Bartonella sp. HY406]
MSDLNIGDKAPEFTLPDDNGDLVSLKELQGKPVVLYFYPKDDTSGCTTEALDFTALINQFRDIGVRVLGISPDSVKKHDKFKEKHQLAVELLADEEKTVLTAYGVWVEKSMYGRKYMGVERTTLLLDANGTIAEIWRKVKVTGHAEAVLKAAQALVA